MSKVYKFILGNILAFAALYFASLSGILFANGATETAWAVAFWSLASVIVYGINRGYTFEIEMKDDS